MGEIFKIIGDLGSPFSLQNDNPAQPVKVKTNTKIILFSF